MDELMRGKGDVNMDIVGGSNCVEGKTGTFEEATYLQMVELKAEMKEELSFIRGKINSHDKVVLLFAFCVIVMMFVYVMY